MDRYMHQHALYSDDCPEHQRNYMRGRNDCEIREMALLRSRRGDILTERVTDLLLKTARKELLSVDME